jgi:VWFA-related protein
MERSSRGTQGSGSTAGPDVNCQFGILALWLACVLSTPQETYLASRHPAQAQFLTHVEGVLLDVSVLDRDRRPIRGLKVTDFTVREDGREQRITSFSEVDVQAPEDQPVSWMRQVPPDTRRNDDGGNGRILVIVMDDMSVVTAREAGSVMNHGKELAHGVIDRLGGQDLAAVVFPSRNGAAQDFTPDRARLLAAVDTFFPDIASPVFPWLQYQSVLATLRRTAESLAELPHRRKALFFNSPGIPMDFSLSAPVPLSLGQTVDETAGQMRDLVQEMRTVFTEARQANVNIYGLDAHGLTPGEDPLSRVFLQTISENTGGTAIVDTNDAGPGISKALRENGSYYLLGYQPSNERAEGRYRTIDVRVNRPGVVVRARKGYFEQSAKSQDATACGWASTVGRRTRPAVCIAMWTCRTSRRSVFPFRAWC